MIRYGELSTKGKNIKLFIQQLAKNIRSALQAHPKVKIHGQKDRMYLILNGEPSQIIIEKLRPIFGIQTFSPVVKVDKQLEKIYQAAAELVASEYVPGQSFKVNAKRADRAFELDTIGLNREVGHAVICAIPEIEVKMKQPDIELRVEIRHDAAYLSVATIKGAGGLPVGSSGKGMLMLSGGIDSPVAGYLAMKRGVEIEAVHFYSPPYTSEQALNKAKELTVKLTPYVGSIQFITVPFTEIQEAIKENVPSGYLMTITRRFMMRLTDLIREKRGGLAIINGESLGQVASQTLESMTAINEVTTTPVIRPVITMDKLEIIDLAEKIDTFDLAVLPFEDCCTIFAPPQPKTKPKLEKVLEYEKRLDVDDLIQRAFDGMVFEKIQTGDYFLTSGQQEFEDLL
ncbi:tRNA 4-thiouridine(8) synthase ThiI [Vagococcus elongatus]|uniref:Probable tRNA sulfurtransferase n=2 Tax=Vagococcus elongatus TaxID=180344 RepID=A0A430ARU5_9ENTE|nr:tRNA 4-thiouridine(8) synthase ThiI [Vagococcus elongatus]